MKVLGIITLLMLNLVVILCQMSKIIELQEELHQERKDSIKEINKLRKKEK